MSPCQTKHQIYLAFMTGIRIWSIAGIWDGFNGGRTLGVFAQVNWSKSARAAIGWLTSDVFVRFDFQPRMKKVNTNQLEECSWSSPKKKYGGAGREISKALGRNPQSTDLMERHPFDVEICRLAPGQTPCPYHSHSAQWEFYHVISGRAGCGIRRVSPRSSPGMPSSSNRANRIN